MQQSPGLQYFYTGVYNQDGGGAATHPAWLQENAKPTQYAQWDNNGGYHLTGGSYGTGQVQGGGGQNRGQVPQQQQTQQPPPPTSTPPGGGIHGEMSKQPLMQNQQPPLNFIQGRIPTGVGNYPFQQTRMTQPQQLRGHGRQMPPLYHQAMQGVLTPTPAQTIAVQYPVMYSQPRQNTPYTGQGQYVLQPPFNYATPSPSYYQTTVMAGPAFQGLSSGGPSPQPGAPGPVPMMRPNLVPTTPLPPPPPKQEPKKRSHAIKIIHPDSGFEVDVESEGGSNNNNVTPTRSNDSSARETPQPNSGVTPDNTVAADFAARVAAVAGEPTTPAQPPPDQPHPPEHSAPSDHSDQGVVPTSDKILHTVLSTASEEFVPRSHKQIQPSEPPVEEQLVPTVSAETNSPAIEIQRSKEFPALKNPPPAQSPARGNSKKKGNEAAAAPQPPQPLDNKEISKKGSKGVQKEENVSLPKERREKTRSVSKEQSPAPSPVVVSEIMSSQLEVITFAKNIPSGPVKETVRSNSLTSTPLEEPTNSKTSQHQNGETGQPEPTPVAVDGSKTSRPKNKKNNKMREQLNRKGVEKEGSDMDAFTTESSIVSEDKERPGTPASPPPSSSSPPPPTIEATAPVHTPVVDKIQEDLEEKEDKQEKLVAAKNEENAKVSALNKAEEETSETTVIEKVEDKKPAQLTLRHSYKKDQWSPLNPEGKKKYERDFLMELKTEPQSNLKPENLPDVVAVIRDTSNNMRISQGMSFLNNRGDIRGMMPDYMKSSQSQRGPMPKGRGSQQGSKKGTLKGPIHLSLSLHEDVKLKTDENAWKPARLEKEVTVSEEEKETQKLYKEVRGILNKLTPQKFDTLMRKFMRLPINSEERLVGVINLIFDKAVDEPNFSKAYANMCKICSKMEVSKLENGQEQKVNFRKILITRCQTEFESNKSSELDAAERLEEIKNCTDPEQKKELQLAYEEKERAIRRKSVGNIRFIGELFKLGMLTPAIMYRCIEHLLSTIEEESLECLCKLLTTIGKDLEFAPQQKSAVSLNPYFQKMNDLSQKREGSKISSRVRFMLQDVIELRHNKWVPRREDNNPKTIEQITKEAERESMEMSIALQQQPPRMNRQNDRQDDRKRGNRGNNNNQNDDGWVNVPTTRFHHKNFTPVFEASKMQNKNEISDLNSLTLGGKSLFIFPGATKSMESKTGPSFTSNNVFSALQSDKKPPSQPSMNSSRRLTPTPSIEKDKERQRMIQGAFESEGRSSRGSSMQRERPQPLSQPPSRDSSVPRQPFVDNKDAEKASRKDEDRKLDDRAAEKLERQTQTIFDEYIAGLTTVEDVKQDIEQFFEADKRGNFIARGLEISLERKAGAQKRIGQLITALMDYNLFSPEIIVDQFSLIYENAEDIAIDVPKFWELQAQVLVPILAAEKVNFSHVKAACSSVLQTKPAIKILVPIFTLLAEEKGVGFVRKVWDSSNVSLKDFLPADINVDAFIKENSLEYLTGEPPKFEPSSQLVPMEEIQEKMLRLMRSNQPCDKIFDFISSNVGDRVESLQFIRALITAICEACISGSAYNLDTPKFKEYEKLIQRYVDNKEDRELACLSSVHNLSSRLEHPQGLIKNIFNLFWDNSLISCDSFLKWKDDDTEKLENKGVSILSLTSFFSALEEVESDDENS